MMLLATNAMQEGSWRKTSPENARHDVERVLANVTFDLVRIIVLHENAPRKLIHTEEKCFAGNVP